MDIKILHAFLLTTFAGLSTGIGSAIALLARRTNAKLLSVSLGFSAGVMIYISFVEILAEAENIFCSRFGEFLRINLHGNRLFRRHLSYRHH